MNVILNNNVLLGVLSYGQEYSFIMGLELLIFYTILAIGSHSYAQFLKQLYFQYLTLRLQFGKKKKINEESSGPN